jgi:hypothetical protein
LWASFKFLPNGVLILVYCNLGRHRYGRRDSTGPDAMGWGGRESLTGTADILAQAVYRPCLFKAGFWVPEAWAISGGW